MHNLAPTRNAVEPMLGQCGSGKTKLINRLLRQLEQQPDSVYLFVTHDLINHTGDNSYGHLNAVHVNVDELMVYKPSVAQNTAIALPYEQLGDYLDVVLTEQLRPYINKLSELCIAANKQLFVVSDELGALCNHELKRGDSPYKLIVSLTPNDGIRALLPDVNTIQL